MEFDGVGADSRKPVILFQNHVPPLLRIPCEVTSEIFQHCLPKDEFPQPSVNSAPIQLTRVCSAWRTLALGSPRLWSKILLSTGTHDCEDTNGASPDIMGSHVVALEVWITRAAPLRLSLHIRYPTLPKLTYTTMRFDKLPPVFSVIVENAARWKDVRLSLPRHYLCYAWGLTQRNASNLESSDIDDTSIPMFGRPIEPHFPVLLREDDTGSLATLSARASIMYTPAKPTPFLKLHKLSLKHSEPRACLHLLKHCPALEDLRLAFYDLIEIVIYSYDLTVLPRLRDFRLSHTGNDENEKSYLALDRGAEMGLILDNLQLPSLQNFDLRMTIMGWARYRDPNLPWDYLSRLITRSKCSLSRLELCSTHIDTPSILECLRLSPDLKHLGIPADEELELRVSELLPSLDSLRILR